MSHLSFGTLPDGREIREAVLSTSAGMQAHVMEFGATLRDLIVPIGSGGQRVVLGFDGLDAYAKGFAHHAGAIAGRYANRIAHGAFELDGKPYRLELNEANRHALHGGKSGFGKRPWTIVEATANTATLALVSEAGDGGYPGTLRLWCRYELIEPSTLALELSATADAATILNLANHSYFNLDGSDDVRDHEFTIAADFYTPTDRELIPTGEIAPVAGTPYDFRSTRPIRLTPPGAAAPFGYDTNFVLRRSRTEAVAGLALAHAATLSSQRNGLTLELFTSEPGLQVFDCHAMEFAMPGHEGRRYGFGAGLALEAQHFPDSPNRAHFPSTILRPGEVYRQRTEYRFSHSNRS
jgi:aldose 1-epimerase